MSNVMVDIETLAQSNNAAIISVGGVKFDEESVDTDNTFYREVSLESCEANGLQIDASTLTWWLEQDESVKQVLTGGEPLSNVLKAFVEWYGDAEQVWANSPSFDCEILETAMSACSVEVPWNYYQERDFRTLVSLPIDHSIERDGDEHDALDDARHQAEIAVDILSQLDSSTVTHDRDRTI